jgi:cation transporter-like permease
MDNINIWNYFTPRVIKLILLSIILLFIDTIVFSITRYIFGEVRMQLIEYRLLAVICYLFIDVIIVTFILLHKYYQNGKYTIYS